MGAQKPAASPEREKRRGGNYKYDKCILKFQCLFIFLSHRMKCGAEIKIDDPSDKKDRMITITGTQKQINYGQFLMQQRLVYTRGLSKFS